MRFFYFFYAWIPFVVLGTIVILVLPWLAVIALMAVLLAAAAALGSFAWAIVVALSGLGHSSKQGNASQRAALVPAGIGGAAPAFVSAAPRSVTRPPLFPRPVDQSEVLEEAGVNPIDVYEHPYMPAPGSTSEAPARRDKPST